MSGPAPLPALLHQVFGHREFRAHQQVVCEAAAQGQDVLLVMPTGAGKSLCYQLPTLARGGTGLVISPLIALMDDQAGKLAALNLRVARIHSGLPREQARQACRDYLEGNLDFLFIAPERLRVPGFPEMLSRRKPALVAIDEAHCISQWGHDFRPDYRTLGQHLPALRPAPVMALTATATPTVQSDIVRALALQQPAIFITGFRRDNLQIEVAELSKPQRAAFIARQLASSASRPAIVYAASRRSAEELASALGKHFPVAAYHAGLDPATRERVQRGFLDDRIEVIVATIAFGMGVDKPNVRTVIHAALPASVEAYYQEIGRAGRDGALSRALLLHSFADRKTHEFLLDRSYPPVSELERVRNLLEDGPMALEAVAERSKLDRETVERCVEKLVSQGAATADFDNTLHRSGDTGWQQAYDTQVRHRRGQIDAMVAYAEGAGCRMHALVRHFGSQSDHGRPCGNCDNCRPDATYAQTSTQPTADERTMLLKILHGLRTNGRSTGKLHTDLAPQWQRKDFDRLLDGLARAALLELVTDTFRTDDGRDISYRKAVLTAEGREPDEAALETVWLRAAHESPAKKASSRTSAKSGTSPRASAPLSLNPEQQHLFDRLQAWRTQEARRLGVPAFLLFHDSVLQRVASTQPLTLADLGQVSGIGTEKLNRFGQAVLEITRGTGSVQAPAHEVPINAAAPSSAAPRSSPRKATLSAPKLPMEPASASAPITRRAAPIDAVPMELTAYQQRLQTRLRDWRQEQASSSGLPTFFVLSETALRKLVTAQPRTLEELQTIAEIGPEKLARYGAAVLELCAAT